MGQIKLFWLARWSEQRRLCCCKSCRGQRSTDWATKGVGARLLLCMSMRPCSTAGTRQSVGAARIFLTAYVRVGRDCSNKMLRKAIAGMDGAKSLRIAHRLPGNIRHRDVLGLFRHFGESLCTPIFFGLLNKLNRTGNKIPTQVAGSVHRFAADKQQSA